MAQARHYLSSVGSVEMFDLQLAVNLPTDFSGDGVTFIIADLLPAKVPVNLWLRLAITADLQSAIVVVLDCLLLQRLREDRLTSFWANYIYTL